MTLSDLHVVLVIDPNRASERERRQRLIEHQGPASNKSLMEGMKQIYSDKFADLQEAKAKSCLHVGKDAAIIIDSTSMEQKELALRVINATFQVLEAKLRQPSEAPYSTAELEAQFVEPLLDMSPERQSGLLDYFPGLVDRTKELTPTQLRFFRTKVREGIESGSEYEFRRMDATQIESKLDEIFEFAKAEGGQ